MFGKKKAAHEDAPESHEEPQTVSEPAPPPLAPLVDRMAAFLVHELPEGAKAADLPRTDGRRALLLEWEATCR